MKSSACILFTLLISFAIVSCTSDDDNTKSIIGQWKLAQVLADPGDGSGVFVNVDSDKTITFLSDNTFSSNGNLCFFSPLEQVTTDGTYSIENEEIYPGTCANLSGTVRMYKIEGGTLIIYYACIEGCAEKFIKI